MIDIQAKNAGKLKRRLKVIEQKLSSESGGLDDALYKGGLVVEKAAVQNASGPRPSHIDRVTGTLTASINTRKTGKATVKVGTNVEYAAIHEFGSSKVPARPYLRPALRDNKEVISRYVTSYINNVLNGGE